MLIPASTVAHPSPTRSWWRCGHEHRDELDDDRLAAFEEAYEAEQDEIRLFRLKALGALVLLYFGFLMVYAVV